MLNVTFLLKARQKSRKVAGLHDGLLRLVSQGVLIPKGEQQAKLVSGLKRDKSKRYFGAATRDAVSAFQKAHKLKPTGEVDKQTAGAINALLDKPGLVAGAKKSSGCSNNAADEGTSDQAAGGRYGESRHDQGDNLAGEAWNALLRHMPYGLSSEEIDWLREGYRMFREGDPAFLDRFAPDARIEVPVSLPAGGTYNNPFEALEFWTTLAELFDPDPEDFLRAGDRVLVIGTWRARSRQAGEEITARFVNAFRVSDDQGPLVDQRFVFFENFLDTAAMLQALDSPGPTAG
jgi:ketosteroid isomerase-like protein